MVPIHSTGCSVAKMLKSRKDACSSTQFIMAFGTESNDHGMARSRAQPDLNVGVKPEAAQFYPRFVAPFGVTAHGLDSRADVYSLGSRVHPALRQALNRSLAPND